MALISPGAWNPLHPTGRWERESGEGMPTFYPSWHTPLWRELVTQPHLNEYRLGWAAVSQSQDHTIGNV